MLTHLLRLQRWTPALAICSLLLATACGGAGPKPDPTPGNNGNGTTTESENGSTGTTTAGNKTTAPKPEPEAKREGPFGEAMAIVGDPAALAAYADKARKKFVEAIEEQPKLASHAWYNIGLLDMRAGNITGAEKAWNKTLSIDPKYYPAQARLAELEIRAGKRAAAVARLESLIQTERFQPEARNMLAQIALEKKDYKTAIKHARNVLLGDPDNVNAYLNLAIAYFDQGLVDQAGLIASNALDRNPKAAALHNIMGLIYLKKDDSKRAVDSFQRALAVDPQQSNAKLNLATLELSYGDFASAVERFEALLKERPKDAMLHMSLGVGLRGLEKYEEAKAAYTKALELDPNLIQAEYNLCVLYQQYMSAYKEAKLTCTTYFKRLGRKDPKFREMQKRLKSIDATLEALAEQQAGGGGTPQ